MFVKELFCVISLSFGCLAGAPGDTGPKILGDTGDIGEPGKVENVFCVEIWRRFLGHRFFVQNLASYIIFSNNELHIILKRINLEICEHSSFLNHWTKKSKGTLKVRFLVDISWRCSCLFRNCKIISRKRRKTSNDRRFLNFDALKWYEAHR